jgi:hypothetical protein
VYGVDAGYRVQEVVCLVNNDHIPLQFDTHSIPGGGVEESVIREHHQLGVAMGVVRA